jgi:hypothetical protein
MFTTHQVRMQQSLYLAQCHGGSTNFTVLQQMATVDKQRLKQTITPRANRPDGTQREGNKRCPRITFNIKLRGFSPQANYTDRATAASRRSYCQLLRIESFAWSAKRIPTAVNLAFLDPKPLLSHSSNSVILTRLSGPRSRPTTSQNQPGTSESVARNSDH